MNIIEFLSYDGSRQLEVIYICGGSGTGKTTLAKHIAEKYGYSFFISGSDNDLLDGIQRTGLFNIR
ncbi:MAG: AAA family ATPase [Lachnospiraceae bacterium]|nr:AAA family ATPase [Lachnospiraceae bacterium]